MTASELRRSLRAVVSSVRKGVRYTVLYRGRPAFQIVPVAASTTSDLPLEQDTLFDAPAVGRSTDGGSADDLDAVVYEH